MRLRVHHRAPPFGVTLHLPKRVPLALLARPASVIAGAYIGLRGRQGAQGAFEVPADISDFISNLDEALSNV
jgi:hypothetical protein